MLSPVSDTVTKQHSRDESSNGAKSSYSFRAALQFIPHRWCSNCERPIAKLNAWRTVQSPRVRLTWRSHSSDTRLQRIVEMSSNSTCLICCGFVVQQVVRQIHNKSTTFRLLDKSTSRHVKMLRFIVDSITNPQQIESMECGFRLVHNKSKSCTTNPQQIHIKSNYSGDWAILLGLQSNVSDASLSMMCCRILVANETTTSEMLRGLGYYILLATTVAKIFLYPL
jgi:hypothetical protein